MDVASKPIDSISVLESGASLPTVFVDGERGSFQDLFDVPDNLQVAIARRGSNLYAGPITAELTSVWYYSIASG